MTKKNDEAYALKWAKKQICANEIGGKCKVCQTDDITVLQFHHINPKTKSFDICQFKEKSLSDLMIEVRKCELLCANHHLEQEQESRATNCLRRRKTKVALLEYKDVYACEKCGYKGKNFASLQFHHIDPKQKTMKVIQRAYTHGLTDRVCDELEICEVLCANCHCRKHIDLNRLSRLKNLIQYKVKNHSPKQRVPKDEVLKLFNEGMKPMEIVRKLKIKNKGNVYRLLSSLR